MTDVDLREQSQRDAIETYLQMLAGIEDRGRSSAAFLREHGRYFLPAALPPGMRRGMVKQCFANSKRAAVRQSVRDREPLMYVEGFACSGGLAVNLPIHHAWLCDAEGRVIDLTWEFPERSAYFGIAFKTDYVRSKPDRPITPLLDDRRDGWRLLRDRSVAEDAIFHIEAINTPTLLSAKTAPGRP